MSPPSRVLDAKIRDSLNRSLSFFNNSTIFHASFGFLSCAIVQKLFPRRKVGVLGFTLLLFLSRITVMNFPLSSIWKLFFPVLPSFLIVYGGSIILNSVIGSWPEAAWQFLELFLIEPIRQLPPTSSSLSDTAASNCKGAGMCNCLTEYITHTHTRHTPIKQSSITWRKWRGRINIVLAASSFCYNSMLSLSIV